MKRFFFVGLTALLFLLFAIAMWQDTVREWTHYQRQFLGPLSSAERRGLSSGVRQVIVSDLNRVDRCMTCHLAIDKPQLTLAEEPFTSHPALPGEVDEEGHPAPFTWHPVEKFGCTVCHGGQGLATEVKAAHGDVKHWEQPLLRGELIQASCYKCHGDLHAIREHVPKLLQAVALTKQHGCVGCHAIHGFGQTVSIDLSDMGDKPLDLLDFTFVEGSHTLAQWNFEHFKSPQQVTPGFRKQELPPDEEEILPSAMPNFGLSDDETWALTIYMLSLTGESLPAKYVTPVPPEPELGPYASRIEAGRAVFEKFGCAGCHGQGGRGGRKNWNAQTGEQVPALFYEATVYDRESLKQFIREGRQPVPRLDPSQPVPPLYMPAWKDKISEEEMDVLVDYLLSLYEQVAQSPSGESLDAP